jgi:probable addiction module antidote protein
MKRTKIKKLSDYKNYDEWVSAILAENSKQADAFLKDALRDFEKDSDIGALLLTLRQVTKAKGGFANLSKKTGLTRETLYRTLSKTGNPTLVTLKAILDALGYCLTLKFAKVA